MLGFYTRPVCVGFVVDKADLIPLPRYFGFSPSVSFHEFSILIYLSIIDAIKYQQLPASLNYTHNNVYENCQLRNQKYSKANFSLRLDFVSIA